MTTTVTSTHPPCPQSTCSFYQIKPEEASLLDRLAEILEKYKDWTDPLSRRLLKWGNGYWK